MADTQEGAGEAGKEVQPFRLLDLPPEIWTRIVRMAVTRPRRLCFATANEEGPIVFGVPAIAKTCHILRDEALKMYYTQNRFKIDCTCFPDDLDRIAESIQSKEEKGYWAMVECIEVETCCFDKDTLVGELQSRLSTHKVEAELLVHEGEGLNTLESSVFEVRAELKGVEK